jgi:2-phosphoglycolate phosphatase
VPEEAKRARNWPQAVVFDFDGTLVDSYPAITASVNHVRSLHGLPPLAVDEVRRYVGHGPTHLLEHTVGGSNVEKDLAAYRAHHPSVLRSGTSLLPGVAGTLATLKNVGIRLGLCTNKPGPFTRALLTYLNIARLFAVVIGPEDAPRIKPAPDMLLAALTVLEVTPAESLYVGDMVVDVQTARAAGVAIWSVATGSDDVATLRQAKPDRLLSSFSELAALLAP